MTESLKKRIVTGLILAILTASGIYGLPSAAFAICALIFIVGAGAWEWASLTISPEKRVHIAASLLAMVIAYLVFLMGWPLLPILLVSAVIWIFIIGLLARYQQGTTFYQQRPYVLKGLGLLVLVPAWYALVNLHTMNYSYVFYVILLIAVADIGAYFAGKRFGKAKLAPSLSPGKTREGALGGLMLAAVCAVVGSLVSTQSPRDAVLFVLFSLLAVMISVVGDLFISLMKREVGAKDSGTLLPGHGGVLDRIDSLLAAIPIFTLGLLWIKAG